MKKHFLLSLIMAILFLVVFSLSACSFDQRLSNNSSDVKSEETESVEEISIHDILLKATDFLGRNIPLDQYTLDDSYDKMISIQPDSHFESNLSFVVKLGDGIPVTLQQTYTSDLLNYGFFKEKECGYQEGDPFETVVLSYDEKIVYLSEDRISDQTQFRELIRGIELPVLNNTIQFDYCGLNINSDLGDVVKTFGNSGGTSTVKYDEEEDTYKITLGYSDQYNSDADYALWVYFTFLFDYHTETIKFYDLYIGT